MRIALLTTFDIQGGAARAAWRLHCGIRQAGHDCTMLTLHKASGGEHVERLETDSSAEAVARLTHWQSLTEMYVNKNRSVLSETIFTLPVPGYDLTCHPVVQSAEVIHLHWVSGLVSPESVAALQILGKPVVWTMHDLRAFTGGCHYPAGCRGFERDCAECPQLGDLAPELAYEILQRARRTMNSEQLILVCPSRWMAGCVRRSALFRESRAEVIPYGLPMDTFAPKPKAEARAALGIRSEGVLFAFGADSVRDRRKGIQVLREAILIARQDPDFAKLLVSQEVQFLAFGWNSDDSDLLGVPVKAVGHVESEEKMALVFSAADVFVCPTLEDNLPNTLLESLACGTPALASRVGGVPEIITSGETGLLFTVGDAVGLAGLLRWAANNPLRLAQWGQAARIKAEREFSLGLQASRYANLYSEVVGAATGPSTLAPAYAGALPLLPLDWDLPYAPAAGSI